MTGISTHDQEWAKTDNQLPDHSHRQHGERYEQGKDESHNLLDSNDQRSIANRLGHASKEDDRQKAEERNASQTKPTEPAVRHGNEPSKGAKVDEELQKEDEEALKKNGAA